ncbi:hypothetical protein [Magnetococcus sp. PR-3]|uniref:hypothetical protein n=1 Tax=Magnetococcus sp. PR-3 TaxID=3120355 RepID=UPI002FCE1120
MEELVYTKNRITQDLKTAKKGGGLTNENKAIMLEKINAMIDSQKKWCGKEYLQRFFSGVLKDLKAAPTISKKVGKKVGKKEHCMVARNKLRLRMSQVNGDLSSELRKHRNRLPSNVKKAYLNADKNILAPLYSSVSNNCTSRDASDAKKEMARFKTDVAARINQARNRIDPTKTSHAKCNKASRNIKALTNKTKQVLNSNKKSGNLTEKYKAIMLKNLNATIDTIKKECDTKNQKLLVRYYAHVLKALKAAPTVNQKVRELHKKLCKQAQGRLTNRIKQARGDLSSELRKHGNRLPPNVKKAYLNADKNILLPLYSPVLRSCPQEIGNRMLNLVKQFKIDVSKVNTTSGSK